MIDPAQNASGYGSQGAHPFRVASPPVVPPPEPPDPYEEALKRSVRRRNFVVASVFGLLLAVPSLFIVYRLFTPGITRLVYNLRHPERSITPADAKTIAENLAKARARSADADRALGEGIRGALAADIGPSMPAGRCPVRFAEPTQPIRSAYGGYGAGIWSSQRAPFAFTKVRSDDAMPLDGGPNDDTTPSTPSRLGLGTPPLASIARIGVGPLASPSAGEIDSAVASLESRAKLKFREGDPGPTFVRESRTLAARSLRHDVVLVIERYRDPSGVPKAGFTSGYVRGRAFVFDHASRAVICAGQVYAQNSSTVDYEYRESRYGSPIDGMMELKMALRADLEFQTIREVARSLRYRAGPLADPTLARETWRLQDALAGARDTDTPTQLLVPSGDDDDDGADIAND